MCGMVGFLNYDPLADPARRKWLTQAIYVDELRGSDSTGLALLPRPQIKPDAPLPAMKIYKKALPASDFLQLTNTGGLTNGADTCTLAMGHNRAATQGDKSNDNYAHPFQSDHITMMHNGTLRTRNGLDHYHVVDSASVCIQLANTEPEAYPELLSELDGAFALVWFNSKTNKMYFARNDERPLVMGRGWGNMTLFYASEGWMISSILPRISDKALDVIEGYYDTFDLPVNELWEYDIYGDTAEHTMRPFKDYVPVAKTLGHNPMYDTDKYDAYGLDNYYGNQYYKGTGKKERGGHIVTFNDKNCPVKCGDELFADCWVWRPIAEGNNKGTISGVSSDYDNIAFSVSNVFARDQNKLVEELKDWQAYLKDQRAEEADSTLQDAFLSGEVTQVTKVKNQNKWVVSLRPSTVSVDLMDLSWEDIKEGDEDVVQTTSEDDTEKKPSAPHGAYPIRDGKGTYNEWLEATKDGCCWCNETLIFADEIVWTSFIHDGTNEEILPCCESCAKSKELMQ